MPIDDIIAENNTIIESPATPAGSSVAKPLTKAMPGSEDLMSRAVKLRITALKPAQRK